MQETTAPGPRLVAVVVHYGSVASTFDTTDSVRRTYPSAAIWVVDNQELEEGEHPIAPTRGIDRWIRPRANMGYGGAIDLAASTALAEGGYEALLALNNDVELEPGAIAALVEELEREPRAAAITPRVLLAGPQPRIWYDGGSIDWARGTARVPGAGRESTDLEPGPPRDVGFVSGCVVLLRLAALAEVGGFDRRYFLYEEDVELSLRLVAAGWRLRHLPAASALHQGQASQRRPDEAFVPIHHPRHPRLERLVELRVANRLLTARRHARGTDRLRFAIGFPLYWLAKSLEAILAGRPRALRAVFGGIRRYRRLRRLGPDDALTTEAATTGA